MMVRLGVVMTIQLGMVFPSLGLVIDTVPLRNTLVNAVPRGLRAVVASQREVVPQVVDEEWG